MITVIIDEFKVFRCLCRKVHCTYCGNQYSGHGTTVAEKIKYGATHCPKCGQPRLIINL